MLFSSISAQTPAVEPGVSQELARWRAAHYSDVQYRLNLTLEKMSPVLKGTIEIRVKVGTPAPASASEIPPIILDWRKIKGHEERSAISNVSINGVAVKNPPANAGGSAYEVNEHLVFRDGVVRGENVIKLDFTSPILTSGSAITRYIDKEDGSEYIYSLFVPSDASTAFPVFDQPDLKARFWVDLIVPKEWKVISNTDIVVSSFHPQYADDPREALLLDHSAPIFVPLGMRLHRFYETKPISSYLFAFAVGDFTDFVEESSEAEKAKYAADLAKDPLKIRMGPGRDKSNVYVRKSQAAKFKPHAAEVFRLNRKAIKYLEEYFDYKFPFPKYDLVLIPEFPFGGMEHAGATFLREASIIFPQEPTKSDHISRAILIFHEAAHQWFGDTVTMRWFDDLWLKEGFANFAAYKAMEQIMPEMNAWKVFYERVKQAAYQTDSTKGTTPIYQKIPNLSAAKSAYGNIVYNKAPAFLRQAEFYLGEDKFRTAVRAFLKKHEFRNAGWEDLVGEFIATSPASDGRRYWSELTPERKKRFEEGRARYLRDWANFWVTQKGVAVIKVGLTEGHYERRIPSAPGTWAAASGMAPALGLTIPPSFEDSSWALSTKTLYRYGTEEIVTNTSISGNPWTEELPKLFDKNDKFDRNHPWPDLIFPNYGDYGYGIFLLDEKSRDYVLKNIQNERDPFLRSMMWGALWDSVREAELAPREYVELAIRTLSANATAKNAADTSDQGGEQDELTIQTILGRVSTAMTYYLSDRQREALAPRLEAVLIDKMQNAPTLGQRVTFYRAFTNIASTENARNVLKQMLAGGKKSTLPAGRVSASEAAIPLKAKDRFDIVTRLLILGDPEASSLLAELEKTETSDDAKRYAYAARAGIAAAEDKAAYWDDFVRQKSIPESWLEGALGPFNSVRHADLTLPYLELALKELPHHKRNRKIFFVNGWLAAFVGGQRSEEALNIVNKFLADNPGLDKDLRLKILEAADVIERSVRIRNKYAK